MRPLHLSTGILAHSSWAYCSICFRFEGCLLQMACFSSFHRCSIGFRSGLIEGHLRTVQCFSQPFLSVFGCVFWVVILLEDPWLATETKLSDTRQHISLQNALIVLRFHCGLHRFKTSCARCSKAAPEHNWTSSMFHSRDSVLFLICLIFLSVNIELMCLTKKLEFCLVCPKNILPEALWLCVMSV